MNKIKFQTIWNALPPCSYPFPFAKVVGRKYSPGPGTPVGLSYVMLLPFFILLSGALPSLDSDGMKGLGG